MSKAERRSSNRRKWRIPCQLWGGKREHNALVLDLSQTGLFIQTHAKTQPGDRLEVRLSGNDGDTLDLVVEVVRSLHIPQNLLMAAKGGIGVRITSAPPEYQQLVNSLGLMDSVDLVCEPELEPEPATEGRRFRVHVAQTLGPRTRRMDIDAPDAETASAHALEQLGDGWKVLRAEPL